MNNVGRFFNLLIFSVFVMAGCESDPEVRPSDTEYLPLQKGFYQVYDVDSTWYTPIEGEQTIHYQLKTVVVDSFLNAESNYTYVIYRYKREDTSHDWQYDNTWSAWMDDLRAVVSEENVAFVKFPLPVSEGRKWNGNLFNNLGEDEYEMIKARKSVTINDVEYDDGIEISQNYDDDPIVRTDIRTEVYARNVGLIRSEVRILNFCTVGCSTFGEIETGVEYFQTLREHGIE